MLGPFFSQTAALPINYTFEEEDRCDDNVDEDEDVGMDEGAAGGILHSTGSTGKGQRLIEK